MSPLLDPVSVLSHRITMTEADLARAREVLQAEQIGDRFRSTVWRRFDPRLADLERRLSQVRRELGEGPTPAPLWNDLAVINADARTILRECLAFVEGVLLRSVGLDRGICDLADALLRELSHRTRVAWSEVSILAEEESIAQAAEIIRVRFPEFSVWVLPVAAHEFGHLVARTFSVNDARGGDERFPILRELRRTGAEERQHHELFADFFGVWSLGPAFAYTAILLRLDPGESAPETRPERGGLDLATHPPSARRAAFLLAALRELDQGTGRFNRPYREVLDTLKPTWEASRAEASQDSEGPGELASQDMGRLNRFIGLATTHLRDARYTGWPRTVTLARALVTPGTNLEVAVAGFSVIDVVNAAWRVRVEHWHDPGFDIEGFEGRALEAGMLAAQRTPAPDGGDQ